MDPLSPAVLLDSVTFRYDRRATHTPPVLSIGRLAIATGERVFVHGPSGSGKTTLLGLIAGVILPQTGTVQVLGQELTTLSASARDRHRGSEMGYIFQNFNLIPYLSVAENIALPCQVHADRRKRIRAGTLHEELARIASRLDLQEHLHRRVTRLSTGQQQRVAIARAVIGSPRLIVADEPTSALDMDRREQFLSLLLGMCDHAGSTVVFVSHDRSLAHRFDRELSIVNFHGTHAC